MSFFFCSRAKRDGWDIVILSDQWTVRNYSSHEAWKPSPLLVQAPPSPPGEQAFSIFPADQRAALASLVCLDSFWKILSTCRLINYLFMKPEEQRNLVLKVSSQTKLNAKFAVDCLSSNDWDFDRAMANFYQVKVRP